MRGELAARVMLWRLGMKQAKAWEREQQLESQMEVLKSQVRSLTTEINASRGDIQRHQLKLETLTQEHSILQHNNSFLRQQMKQEASRLIVYAIWKASIRYKAAVHNLLLTWALRSLGHTQACLHEEHNKMTKCSAVREVCWTLLRMVWGEVAARLHLWNSNTKQAKMHQYEHRNQCTSINLFAAALKRCLREELAGRVHSWRLAMQLEMWSAQEAVHRKQQMEGQKQRLLAAMQNATRSSSSCGM